jgi:putative toxin-antitoxin system antitoxin component (TIGR02293 family)
MNTRSNIDMLSYSRVALGIPASFAREIEGQGLTRDDIRTVIPDRTLDRRIAQGAVLKVDEADGIARLLRVVDAARRVFGDDTLADEWLRTTNPDLGDIPIQMARTDLGGREVESALGRIEHGVFG